MTHEEQQDENPKITINQYGFDWGSLQVTRQTTHKGAVFLQLKTPKGIVNVRATKTGKINLSFEGKVSIWK